MYHFERVHMLTKVYGMYFIQTNNIRSFPNCANIPYIMYLAAHVTSPDGVPRKANAYFSYTIISKIWDRQHMPPEYALKEFDFSALMFLIQSFIF